MNESGALSEDMKLVEDICCLSLVRRMSALMNRDDRFQQGDKLPRGWHVIMFNPPTLQSELRHDGAASLGVEMPDLGLPKLMMGGRSVEYSGDIPIGGRVVRRSRLGPVSMKEGRSGAFALLNVEHSLSVVDGPQNVVVETISYIMRSEQVDVVDAEKIRAETPDPRPEMDALPDGVVQSFTPNETHLFRYSAITDNPHRIHYDFHYATRVEGYPSLVVNGTLPQMFLLEMFREYTGREPVHYEARNLSALYCGAAVSLLLSPIGNRCVLMARNEAGKVAIEAEAW